MITTATGASAPKTTSRGRLWTYDAWVAQAAPAPPSKNRMTPRNRTFSGYQLNRWGASPGTANRCLGFSGAVL